MELLEWQQDAGGLHVSVSGPDGSACVFSIDNSLINYLLAGTPRIYHVFLQFGGSDQEECRLLDLSALRPVIQKANALRMSLGRKSQSLSRSSGVSVGRYCLARGESYHDRFLAQSGWVSQRLYQDVYASAGYTPNAQPAPSAAPQQPAFSPEPQQSSPDSMMQEPATRPAPAQQQEADDFDLDLTI